MRKAFAPILVLIAVISVVVIGLLLFKNKTNLNSTSQDTSSWETFRGTHFAYLSFKYPGSWIVTNAVGSVNLKTSRSTGTGLVDIVANDNDLEKLLINNTSTVKQKEQVSIDGYLATKLTGYYSGEEGRVYFVTVITRIKNKSFSFALSTRSTDLEKILTDEFEAILSTVKFL